jgi:hypothetical protein
VVQIPDRDEHRRRWSALGMADRRRIMRAVNRGEPVADRREALLAVPLARQQQRFWRRAWLIGPLLSLVFAGQGWQTVVANALVASLILGLMSLFWLRRATRSEHANLRLLGLEPEPAAPRRLRGRRGPAHGDRDAATEDDAGDEVEDGRAGMPHAQNPPKRSRSRRRRG